jgi:tRNA(Ile)-lysidine synthase
VVIQREVLRRAIGVAAGQLKDVEREHVEMVRELFNKNVGRRLHLPYQLQAVRTYEGIAIKREAAGEAQRTKKICMDVRVPGTYNLPGPGMAIELSVKDKFNPEEIPINRYTKWFDYDKIKNGLAIRTRENGDFITLDGDGHRKLLKRWMIDEKIPREAREDVLLLADGNRVLWIVGHRISDNYKVTDTTRRVLVAEIKGDKSDGRQYQNIVDGGRSRYPDSRTG